ncbi:MAG: methionine gamma-lyase family protein, partial [Clostridia bacterium]|nr:methionine gamma-lyase family protein [Clostridia bacterium]
MTDNINQKLNAIERSCQKVMNQINEIALYNQEKVLSAFQKEKIALGHFAPSSGYGYDDIARPKLCALYADIFKAEKAFISPLVTCGTHAIFLALRASLCPGDLAISITGKPYDTLLDCLYGKNIGSLADDGIKFETIPMLGSKINLKRVLNELANKKPKLVYIQRSRGYSKRKTLTIEYLEDVFKEIRKVCPKTIIMVDN